MDSIRIFPVIIFMGLTHQVTLAQTSQEILLQLLTESDRSQIDEWREQVLDATGELFNEYQADEVGSFLESISSITDTISDIQARAYMISSYCAYLNNSSQFEKAEECCLVEIDLGKTYNNAHVLAGGYEDIAFIYNHQGRYDEQIGVLKKAVTVREEAGHSVKDVGYAIMWLGEAYSYLQKFDSAYYYLAEVQELVEQSGDSSFLCNVYEKISRVALEQGDFQKSIDNSKEALEIARKLDDRIRRQTNLMYLGYSSYYIGRYHDALAYELQGLEEYQGQENSSTASSYVRLGRIYNGIDDYDQAINYLQRAIDYNQSTDYEVGVAKAYVEIGLSYIEKENFDYAAEVLAFAKEVFENTDDDRYLSMTIRREALLAHAQGRCQEAIEKVTLAQDIMSANEAQQSNATAELEFAQVLANCNQPSRAYQMAISALTVFEKYNDIHGLQKANDLLYRLDLGFNNTEAALEHLEASIKYQSKISNQNNIQAIASERARFEVELSEEREELAIAKNQILESRNRMYLILASGLVVIIGLLAFFANKVRTLNHRLALQNEDLSRLNQTKDRFFGIIAHDLRSPLAAFQGVGRQIRSYVKKGYNEKLVELSGEIEETSTNLSSLLDNLLNWSLLQLGAIPYKPSDLYVSDHTHDAIDVFLPLSKKKSVSIEVNTKDNHTIFADSRAYQTVVRNLVANAIKYTSEGGTIKVDSSINANKTLVTIRDNGNGMTKEQLEAIWNIDKNSVSGTSGEKGTGLGILLCKQLVEQNKGEISIDSAVGEGTTVTVTFFSCEKLS